jgi:predicted O-methyltransferase YrrM
MDHIRTALERETNDKIIHVRDSGRNDLASYFNLMGFKRGVEVGTERGKYAKVLCDRIPGLRLYTIDPYLYYDDDKGYKDNLTQKDHDNNFREAKERLAPYKCTIIRAFSLKAVHNFEDNSLDFVYIDGNHRLEYVVSDLVEWTKKVKPGGIVAGHDWIRLKDQHYSHVPYAVIAYLDSYGGYPLFILDQKSNDRRDIELNKQMDRIRSWFFVKK